MNRRNFFKAAGAAVLGGVLGKATEGAVRLVEYSASGEPPAIIWMRGHRPRDLFVSFPGKAQINPADVRYGWGSRQLSLSGMYLSDVPKEGFEPITYCLSSETERNI